MKYLVSNIAKHGNRFLIVAYIRISGLEMFFTGNSTEQDGAEKILGFNSADEWFSMGRDTVYFYRGFC